MRCFLATQAAKKVMKNVILMVSQPTIFVKTEKCSGWIAMKFSTDILVEQKKNSNDFSNAVTSPTQHHHHVLVLCPILWFMTNMWSGNDVSSHLS